MKKILFTILAMVACVTMNAQKLTAEKTTVEVGSEENCVVVKLEGNAEAKCTLLGAYFEASEGLEIDAVEAGEQLAVKDGRKFIYTFQYDDESKMAVAYTLAQRVIDDGEVFLIWVKVKEGFKSGTIKLYKVEGSDAAAKSIRMDDLTIQIEEATPVKGVKGDNEASSDVRKVAKKNKLYIVNGEKEINVAGAAMK